MKEVGNQIKVVFMGTPAFAKESLQRLVEKEFEVLACVTNPDKPAGRGMKVKMSAVKEYALAQNIPVYQPQKVRNNPEMIATLQGLKPDFLVVVAYGKILPKEILDIPTIAAVNVHGSLLPKYRGAAPMQWSIINGDNTTGITTMLMDVGMDTGDMLLKQETAILPEDTLETIHDRLMVMGADLLCETLYGLKEGNITPQKQGEAYTLAPPITREMTKINFHQTARDVFNFMRGLSPFPATYMESVEGKKYKVYQSNIIEETSEGVPGTVLVAKKDQLVIQCQKGSIGILEIQPENSKKMPVQAFLAGNKIKEGDMFL